MLVPVAVCIGGVMVGWMFCGRKPKTIAMGDGWWGAGQRPPQSEDSGVRTFTVEVSDVDIKDLYERLDHTRFFSPLEDSQFHYGFNSMHLKKVVSYWRNDFDWNKQVARINRYPHYKTTIEGLEVHYIHVKPPKLQPGQKARPLLMVHGWPGSFYEFYGILPLLTEPAKHGLNPDIIFEVICPSIPGYGFSEAPHKKGFSVVSAARIFHKLMTRLGFKEFYVQGGDWGAIITTVMSEMKPESIKGLHVNMVFLPQGGLGTLVTVLIGRYLPWLVGMTREDVKRLYPYFEKNVYAVLRESGYMHLQATKPDTVGCALYNSPAGLAAYILEKFSTWTDPEFRHLEDGGLERRFSMDDLLTNVMIYWITGSVVSSMRLYKEVLTREFQNAPETTMAVYVPTGIASFPCELLHAPRVIAQKKFKNIVTYSYMPRGGHFAAMEEPEILAQDIQIFVSKVERA
ncbi:epoxide hydrolase 1-like [Pelodytes ibericus]